MKNLALIKSANFGNVQCDFWENENGDVFMTAEQLGMVLSTQHQRKASTKLLVETIISDNLNFHAKSK